MVEQELELKLELELWEETRVPVLASPRELRTT